MGKRKNTQKKIQNTTNLPKGQKSIKAAKKQKTSTSTKRPVGLIIGICVLIIVILIFAVSINNKGGKPVDLSNMTVAEACKKAESNGWKNIYVTIWSSENNYRQSDCSNQLNVADYEIDEQSCIGAFYQSLRTKHNVCIDAYENGYTGKKKEESASTTSTSSDTSSKDTSANTSSQNINTSFREIMDGYESFMNSYIDFMKKYKNASSTEILSMASDYSKMLKESSEWSEKINNYNSDNLSAEDWAYYLEVYNRVLNRFSEIE